MPDELQDVELIRRALVAAVDGPYLDEWEFSTLIGLEFSSTRKRDGARGHGQCGSIEALLIAV